MRDLLTEVINVAKTLKEFIAACSQRKMRQMPEADIHFPEERDEMCRKSEACPNR